MGHFADGTDDGNHCQQCGHEACECPERVRELEATLARVRSVAEAGHARTCQRFCSDCEVRGKLREALTPQASDYEKGCRPRLVLT